VWDWLRIGFGRERVFRDVANTGPGNGRSTIEAALAASKACVVVIGRHWDDATNLPRLQEASDRVCCELETALALEGAGKLTVVPLLVEEAQLSVIPTRELPDSLRPLLSASNVLAVSESDWEDDTRRLIAAIAEAMGAAGEGQALEEWGCQRSGPAGGVESDAVVSEGSREVSQHRQGPMTHF
jgi:hypothetical protein